MRNTIKSFASQHGADIFQQNKPAAHPLDGNPVPEGNAADEQWKELQGILSRYYGEWTSPDYPGAVNTRIPNTALLGNGNIGVSSAGSDSRKSFHVSKGDFWEYNNCPMRIGTISVGFPPEENAEAQAPAESVDFRETEDILHAKTVTRQTLCGIPLQMESWMSAVTDLFVMKITSLAKETAAEIRISLEARVNGERPVTAEVGGDCMIVTRSTVGAVVSDPKSYTSKAAMAARVIGKNGVYAVRDGSTAYVSVPLSPGETVYLVTAICGGGRTYDCSGSLWSGRTEPVEEVKALLDTVTSPDDAESLYEEHLQWWKNYWMQSYIRMDTEDADLEVLQKYYYAAQYELGSGIRKGRIAAGLYGIWHTSDKPNWHSDFHLNYNFISTYYGLATGNRVSMLLPAVEALMDYVPQGIANAGSLEQLNAVYAPHVRELIEKGQIDPENGIPDAILFPVAIGPYGMTLEHNSYHHETVNAPFSAYPLIEYYNFTQDETFMRDTLYVYLKYVLNFLEHWLIEENGGYTLYAGYNEGSWAVNPALELSVYKMCLKYGIRISEKLGTDEEKRAVWQKIHDGLAAQPVVENYNNTGKTLLSLAEKEWRNKEWMTMSTPVPGDGNCIPLESIIPGEVFGYYSDRSDLEILQNTIQEFSDRGAWTQINNFPKLSPVAVNARYDCRKIIAGLSGAIRSHMKQNMMIDDGVHGIEKAGAAKAIHNMMLLSDRGVIKLFGNWPEDKDAEFVRLRASGAFVFSAAYDGNTREITEGVTMYSEAGAVAVIASPWKEGMIVLDENGGCVDTVTGTAPNHPEEITYTFRTESGRTYIMRKCPATEEIQ